MMAWVGVWDDVVLLVVCIGGKSRWNCWWRSFRVWCRSLELCMDWGHGPCLLWWLGMLVGDVAVVVVSGVLPGVVVVASVVWVRGGVLTSIIMGVGGFSPGSFWRASCSRVFMVLRFMIC